MSKAKIIADSISESGIRITTMELEFERFLLSQFNTHRMFSRSAQSSRAVPVQKMIDTLNSNETPVFRKAQAGMQAGVILNDAAIIIATDIWNLAKQAAIYRANDLKIQGVAKEITNRLLEPFSTVKVVVTATEWENFFALRLHHAAQPEMQDLAQAMKTAMDESVPIKLDSNEWHLPYIDTYKECDELYDEKTNRSSIDHFFGKYDLRLISAARCARVSYLNHDNSTPDIEKDLELAQRLLADKHLSPFEHQARPMEDVSSYEDGVTHSVYGFDANEKWSGNFRGWIQNRQLVDL
jgi:thymidylate synthase ThyX